MLKNHVFPLKLGLHLKISANENGRKAECGMEENGMEENEMEENGMDWIVCSRVLFRWHCFSNRALVAGGGLAGVAWRGGRWQTFSVVSSCKGPHWRDRPHMWRRFEEYVCFHRSVHVAMT